MLNEAACSPISYIQIQFNPQLTKRFFDIARRIERNVKTILKTMTDRWFVVDGLPKQLF